MPSDVKPPSFHRILSNVSFNATQSDLKMSDCFKNDTPMLDEMEPMHLTIEGPAIRAAKWAAGKECQTESWATRATPSRNENREQPHELVDTENDGESQPRSATRVAIESDGVVGVLNDWILAAIIPSSGTPNTDRTRAIPFIGLQPLPGKPLSHLWHDAESFIWLFLWVCGCSDGSEREVLVTPYKKWRKLDMRACKMERSDFLSWGDLEDINVSEHHASNSLFCYFLTRVLGRLLMQQHLTSDISTGADHNLQEQKDMAEIKALLFKFQEVRSELNKNFSSDWFSDGRHYAIREYINTTAYKAFVTR